MHLASMSLCNIIHMYYTCIHNYIFVPTHTNTHNVQISFILRFCEWVHIFTCGYMYSIYVVFYVVFYAYSIHWPATRRICIWSGRQDVTSQTRSSMSVSSSSRLCALWAPIEPVSRRAAFLRSSRSCASFPRLQQTTHANSTNQKQKAHGAQDSCVWATQVLCQVCTHTTLSHYALEFVRTGKNQQQYCCMSNLLRCHVGMGFWTATHHLDANIVAWHCALDTSE